MDLLSQRPLYSTDPSTKGFDLSSGKIWIYPENYPLREYQFQIVQSALYHNTLVCLPTGLGKTFVAAVVMYNFWRWYPLGKIVFLAPTKPLVAQQINACHDIMGIPSNETVELTGTTDQKKRQVAWLQHRVIFATPQVFQKDLEKNIVPSDLVKCVVVDEAHKALGKHSYCESIRLLSEQNQYFRVLALSATPGGKLDAVQEVVRNLHITHMELRDDTSPDIIPYINERKLDIVLVGLGHELEGFKERYIIIMDRHVRVLVESNVLRGFAGNISKGRIFHLQKEWQQKPNRGGNHGKIMKTLTILMTMYHAYELMVRHGLRAFYNFYQKHLDKFWLNDEKGLLSLLEEINYYLGPFPDVRPMPDGSVPEIPEDIRFGHNKFQKLKELLLRHFQSFEDKEEETRAIVFVEYRDIVNEVYVLLLQLRPLIRPQKFVGQAGQKQKQQKLALEDFRSNKVNVLISTSVGEEGLDVGEVDLIVCFDISQQSPIRLVQRMGRTGRKRDGHIVVLVTDGKEHQTLKSTMSRRDSLNNKVLHSSGIINALHEESPRMVPADFEPECQKMVMTVVPKIAPVKGKGKIKEPKKPRKRLDANNKTKNSKLVEPSTSSKPGGSQSSLKRFFQKPTEDPQMEVDDDFTARAGVNHTAIPSLSGQTVRSSQTSQQIVKTGNTIKLSEVLLLSSDDAAVEFLTLCTLKKSKNEQAYIDRTSTNPYLPAYHTNSDKNNNFFDFEVPDLKILDCLKNITDCVVPSTISQNDDDMICEPSNRFNYFDTLPQNVVHEEHSKFEALLDESSSDSAGTVFQLKEVNNKDSPMNEQVDWGENIDGLVFEDLLDEWSEESRTSVEKNEPKGNKTNELPCQSPVNILNEPGVFEDILDWSTDESDTDCNQQIINLKAKSPEEKATTKNPFDQSINVKPKILQEKAITKNPSDQNINVKSKILEEKATTNNSSEMLIDNEFKGTFEDILNSSFGTETDFDLENINDGSKTSKNKSTMKNPTEMPIDDEFKGTFEDILNSSSGTETDFDLEDINVQSKTSENKATTKKPSETMNNESKGAFEAILDTSSDGSETDCSLELGPDVQCASNKILASKKPSEHLSNSRSRDSPQVSKQTCTSRISGDTEIDGSIDLLADYVPEAVSQHLTGKNDRRNFKILSNSRVSPTSDLSKNSNIPPCNELTVSQTLREVKRTHSMKNVNNGNEGEKAHGRSTSPVFPDWPRASYTSRLSGTSIREPVKELLLSRSNDPIDEIAESEEDIFGTDDLMVDSDFEAEINNIEKSAAQNTLHSVDIQKPCGSSAKNIREVGVASEIVFENKSSSPIVNRSSSAFDEASRAQKRSRSSVWSEKDTEDLSRPARTSFRCELKLDDCEWDNGETKNLVLLPGKQSALDTVDLTDSDWGIKKKNIRNPSPAKKTVSDTVNLTDCSWGNKKVKSSIPPRRKESSSTDGAEFANSDWNIGARKKSISWRTKESLSDTVHLSDIFSNASKAKKSTSSSTKQSVTDIIDLTDCDWDEEDARNPTLPPVKQPAPDTVDFEDHCAERESVKSSTPAPVKESSTDIVLEDCDWSSDFETVSSPLKPSTSFQKTTEIRDSPKSISNSLQSTDRIGNRFSKLGDTTGWISAKKPKLSLSLGKKSTKNICTNLLTKQIFAKAPTSKDDSDSENEFAVGRLETTLTKQLDNNFFAKPDPVDKVTKPQPLGMSNRRILRGPLTLRRNNGNKLAINGLSAFAAPKKYSQQETRKTLSVGVGRQKSASVNLDTRKKRQKHQVERKRPRVRSEFIDDEAEVSTDGNYSAGSSGTDDDLHDFVSYSQPADESIDMQAHYLQTIQNPRNPGAFHIRKPRSPSPDVQIYSQAVPDEPDDYLQDSFCVEDDDVFEGSETPEEISILEQIEMSLKRKKRKRVQSHDTRANQKRRLVAPPADTSSSEDEFEKLRRQIRDESFTLKNKS